MVISENLVNLGTVLSGGAFAKCSSAQSTRYSYAVSIVCSSLLALNLTERSKGGNYVGSSRTGLTTTSQPWPITS